MPDNLNIVLNKYDLTSLFISENSEFISVNASDAQFTEKQTKQSLVVLKQTLSALQGISFKKMIIKGKDKISVFIQDSNRIIGYVAKREIDEEDLIKALNAPVVEEEKVEEVAAVEEEKKEEVVRESVAPKMEEKEIDAKAVKDIDAIAEEYLEDFAFDIIDNIKADIGLTDSDSYSSSFLLKYVNGIEQSASMLIGPTRAEEMKEKMKKLLV